MMVKQLWSLDVDTLKKMYTDESAMLANALLEGSDWETLNEQRILVTGLSIIIEQKSSGAVDSRSESAINTIS